MSSRDSSSPLRIALIMGGDSSEREISILSGTAVADSLRKQGYLVTELDPSSRSDLVRLINEQFDVAFLTLHGKNGEDGTIQGLLELLGIPYTGSGIWSSATAIDKNKTKDRYLTEGIPTPSSVTISTGPGWTPDVSFPCVVKVPEGGSSIGVTVVRTREEFDKAVEVARDASDCVLVEDFISGREFTVAVLGNREAKALPAIELSAPGDLDFDTKYRNGTLTRTCPAHLTEAEAGLLSELAVRAHTCLECRGASRTDFILDDQGKFWALETNTLPGMRDGSFIAQEAEAAGLSYDQLCNELVILALQGRDK